MTVEGRTPVIQADGVAWVTIAAVRAAVNSDLSAPLLVGDPPDEWQPVSEDDQ